VEYSSMESRYSSFALPLLHHSISSYLLHSSPSRSTQPWESKHLPGEMLMLRMTIKILASVDLFLLSSGGRDLSI
jgi:hypothetical protein